MSEEKKVNLYFYIVGVCVAVVIGYGVFGFSYYSIPGDLRNSADSRTIKMEFDDFTIRRSSGEVINFNFNDF